MPKKKKAKAKGKAMIQKCGKCRRPGHNRRTCKSKKK